MLSLSVREFCHSVGISQRTFWNLRERGEGPPIVRVGRRVLIRIEAAETWLKTLEGRPDPKCAARKPGRGPKPDAKAERGHKNYSAEDNVVQITARIPATMHSRLRRHKFETRESINSMILDGLEAQLK